MSRLRPRFVAVVATLVAVVLLTSPTLASAQTTPLGYHAKGDATGLNLQVFGQGITLGVAHADVASDPKASGRGVGALLPGPTAITEEKFDATADGDSKATANPPVCGPITLRPASPWLRSRRRAPTPPRPSRVGFRPRRPTAPSRPPT